MSRFEIESRYEVGDEVRFVPQDYYATPGIKTLGYFETGKVVAVGVVNGKLMYKVERVLHSTFAESELFDGRERINEQGQGNQG